MGELLFLFAVNIGPLENSLFNSEVCTVDGKLQWFQWELSTS